MSPQVLNIHEHEKMQLGHDPYLHPTSVNEENRTHEREQNVVWGWSHKMEEKVGDQKGITDKLTAFGIPLRSQF